MSKRSIPLSTLLDNAVADHNPSVNINLFGKIVHAARKNEQVCLVLRLQLLNKLKSHPFRFIPSLEVYYCVCLLEYLVIKVRGFVMLIQDEEFVKSLDKMAQLGKLVGLFKSKPTLAQLKVMNFIQLVMTYDNTELYKELYTTYRTKGVNFPPLTQPDYDDKDATSVTQTPALPFDIETNCKPKEGLSPVKNKVELPQPQKLAVQDVSTNEIFETLPADFRKLLQTMSEFHELCKEPLKRSNLLRNGSLQLHHQLQCDENFFKKAIDIQKEFKNRFNEYSNVEEPDDEIIAALTEEGRKIGHIVRVFKNEISRIKKLETKIEDGVGDMKLAEVPSYGVDAMMSAGVAYPKTTSEAVKIMDMMSHTKGNTLSREDSVTESTSNSETPAGNGHMQQRKSMLFFPPIAPLPQESSKAISFKGIKKENIVKMTSSVDTTRMYTGFL